MPSDAFTDSHAVDLHCHAVDLRVHPQWASLGRVNRGDDSAMQRGKQSIRLFSGSSIGVVVGHTAIVGAHHSNHLSPLSLAALPQKEVDKLVQAARRGSVPENRTQTKGGSSGSHSTSPSPEASARRMISSTSSGLSFSPRTYAADGRSDTSLWAPLTLVAGGSVAESAAKAAHPQSVAKLQRVNLAAAVTVQRLE